MRFDLLATNFNAQSVMRNSVNYTPTPKHFSLFGAPSRLILRLKEVTSQVANCVSDLSQQPDGLESHDAQQEPTSKPHSPDKFCFASAHTCRQAKFRRALRNQSRENVFG
jgi:hypothetical protein